MDFKFPDVGEGIHEGVIVKWHIKPGDHIKKDDVLCEVETDKAVVEIPSPEEGEIEKLYHEEGETVNVGEVLVSYKKEAESKGENDQDSDRKMKKLWEKQEQKPEPTKKEELPEKKNQSSVVGKIMDADITRIEESGPLFDALKERKKPETKPAKDIKILPALRELAKNLKVDLNEIKGTWKNGQITEEDIKNAVKDTGKTLETKATSDQYGAIEYEPLSPVRKTIAKHLKKTFEVMIPVSQTHHCDVTELNDYRKQVNEKYKKEDVHFTFLPFISIALIQAAKEFFRFNAECYEESDGLLLKKYVNLGIAVDTGKGLFVPVIKQADEKDIKTIAREMKGLVSKVKDRTIKHEDLTGATITITNYGSLGSVHATPVIYYPNTCILGIGAIQKTLKLIDEKPVERLILPLTLTYDHRFNDGADAARFLNVITEGLEDPKKFHHGLL